MPDEGLVVNALGCTLVAASVVLAVLTSQNVFRQSRVHGGIATEL